MFRNKYYACLLFVLGMIASAQASSRELVLLLGDVESRPAVLAMRSLQTMLKDQDIKIRIIAANSMSQKDRAALVTADVAVISVVGRQLVQRILPELESMQRSQRMVFAVGSGIDDELRVLGLREEKTIQKYYRAGGIENMTNMLRYVLRTQFGVSVTEASVQLMPEIGLYDVATGRTYSDFEQYAKGYTHYRPGAPWIGVMFFRASLVAGQTLPLAAIVARLEKSGYNVMPVFGYPYEVPLQYFLNDAGQSRVELIVALGMKVGGTAATSSMLDRIGVPAINAITLSQQSAEQWKESKTGLNITERSWQLAGAELAGLIQPTVVASRERITDVQTELAYIEEQPIAERIDRLAERVNAWLALRQSANADKRIVMLYYNYPHGSETIGASYLNVLPESLWQIVQRMDKGGYRTSDASSHLPADKQSLQDDIQKWGNYPSKSSKDYRAGLAQLATSGQALLVPLSDYLTWYEQFPAELKSAIEKAWGVPQKASTLWRDANGRDQFVFPARRYGNLLMAPQPGRAWEQNLEKLHDDVSLPPSHEYIAFYLWLQHGYRAHAVMHIGTHGTHEWLTGKEAGLSAADPTEALIGAVPNIYPYVMDDVGEGLQAKRRGMATIIDHMTPPFDVAGLNPDLRELLSLLNDYRVANQKSPLLARNHLIALNRVALNSGVLKDMQRKTLKTEADLEALEEYLDNTADKLAPFGLHTFGVPPDAEFRRATAKAAIGLDKSIDPQQQAARIQKMEDDIVRSADMELDNLMLALDGHYISPGPSADLVRNPDALPTGRNFYGLDPARIPSRTTYEQGALLAKKLIEDYRSRHGTYPDKLAINLWGVETLRHEGIMEAQVLALLGVKPVWDERGRVIGVEAISRRALARPRVDVTMISSGLFRDLFGNLLKLLDDAAQLAQKQDDADNPLHEHTRKMVSDLQRQGLSATEAERLATVRIFGLPSGAYGTNIEKLIPLANVWQNEQQVADVFINRMSHPFGRSYWGGDDEAAEVELDPKLRRTLFKQALSGSKIALHSRSSNLYATLDNDDFFQYLGGTALAIRSVDGKTPEVMVSDLSNPRNPHHTSLQKYMGQELQSRYLNPRWANRMLQEGYSGARFINRVVDYLWAWQVTVPEAVDATKWQRMYDTYIADKHGLDVRRRFAESGNLKAYQAITDRMLTVVERGYWQPSQEVRDNLARVNAQTIASAGVACNSDSCSRTTLKQAPNLGVTQLPASAENAITGANHDSATATAGVTAPTAVKKNSAPHKTEVLASKNAEKAVSGFEMQSISNMSAEQKTIGALLLLILAASLMGFGYWRQSKATGKSRRGN